MPTEQPSFCFETIFVVDFLGNFNENYLSKFYVKNTISKINF